jgi:predicted GNAT superfamily acetyltransferase
MEEAVILTRLMAGENALPFGSGRPPSSILIEVPNDISEIAANLPSAAAEWQASIRQHFQWALKSGYTVTGLQRDSVTSRSFYTLKLDGNSE